MGSGMDGMDPRVLGSRGNREVERCWMIDGEGDLHLVDIPNPPSYLREARTKALRSASFPDPGFEMHRSGNRSGHMRSTGDKKIFSWTTFAWRRLRNDGMYRSKDKVRTVPRSYGQDISERKETKEDHFVHRERALEKQFQFKEVEPRVYEFWENTGLFAPSDRSGCEKPPFVMCMPPPNVTGKLHMGHAMFVTLQDIMTRFARMQGRSTLWLPGTDHAGIATQLVVEKMLAQEGIKRTDLDREEFVEKVWDWRRTYGGHITQQLRRLGASCDWSREQFTLDEHLSKAVVEAFVRLDEKGLVYRGSYMVNWSPVLQTAVSDLEVEYSDEEGKLYFFKYPLLNSKEFLEIATTRPETILGDTAIAVHPEDERYAHLVGKEAVVPMTHGRTIPIIADTYVDREFGTGALKITPGHDPNDYAIGQKFGLEIINIMNKDGTMNANALGYEGLSREKCRERLWEDLTREGLAVRAENHMNRVPRSQRGGEVIEPMVSEQWFVRMEPLAGPALSAVTKGNVEIIPKRFEKVYSNWLTGIKDWCVSRQLWWGHQIPVWYIYNTAEEAESSIGTNHSGRPYVVARNKEEALQKAHDRGQSNVHLIQDPDVLDTWFSSGLWPFSTLGWPDAGAPDFVKFYPTQMLETGHDILFFWVARMMMMGIEFTGKPPFDKVFLHGLVRDEEGRKMSKSLGNVIDPLDVIDTFGADALRFSLATGTTPGQDINLSMSRVEANRNLSTKLWNAGKFILSSLDSLSKEEKNTLARERLDSIVALSSLQLAERWIISSLHQLVDHVTDCNERLDFGESGRSLYEFFWGEFADWYIESSKTRLYGNDNVLAAEARAVLLYCFQVLLKLWHPFMPFITEEMWHCFPFGGKPLIAADWPMYGLPRDEVSIDHYETLKACVRNIRNARSEYSVLPKQKIAASLVVKDRNLQDVLVKQSSLLSTLARVEESELLFSDLPPSDATESTCVHLAIREGVEVFLPMANMVDPVKEVARLEKQVGKLEKELEACANRLSLPSFVEKAPEAVVAKAKAELREKEEKLKVLAERLSLMRKLQGRERF